MLRRENRSKSGTTEPLVYETVEVPVPPASAPALGFGFDALIIDGQVQGLKWLTRGLAEQALVLAALKEKFGEPASSGTVAAQNGFGATYQVVHAAWRLPRSVTVAFDGAGGRVDQGSVAIMSDAVRHRVMKDVAAGARSTPM